MKNFLNGPNTAVFTTKYILEKKTIISYVFHYEEDGAWQFSSNEDCNNDDYRIISLEEMIDIDPTILNIADLPLGFFAKRNNKKSKWIVEKLEN